MFSEYVALSSGSQKLKELNEPLESWTSRRQLSVDAAPQQARAATPEMIMIPSPGDTSAIPLDSSYDLNKGYDSLAPITLPRYHLEVGGGANGWGTQGVCSSRGEGTVGGRLELAGYDNRAYDGEPQRNTHL